MKRLILFNFLLLSTTIMSAQKPQEVSALEKINLKPIETIFDEQLGKIDKDNKMLRVKRNENFKSDAKTAEEVVYSYLLAKYDVYGLKSNLEDIKIIKTIKSPSGQYLYCQQYMNNIPVYATNFTVFINTENTITYVLNEFRNIVQYENIASKSEIPGDEALKIASDYLNIKSDIIGTPKMKLVYFESIDNGLELAWKVNIISMKPMGDWQIFVSATNRRIIHAENIAVDVDVNAKIFNPNPINTAQTVYGSSSYYKDNNDATNSSLNAQLQIAVLYNIKLANGIYSLQGKNCIIADIENPMGHNLQPVITTSGGVTGFNYARNQTEFEAIMCYFHVDAARKRMLELGYNASGLDSIKVDPHGLNGADNSHYVPSANYLAFGDGGVDDAEDADVIWHEYGHAIQNNLGVGNMSSVGETMSLKEGSSDYWAVSYKRSLSSYNWWLFADWDGHNEFWAGRNANLNWVYPTNYVPGHSGGQIWSSALMKIWSNLGRNVTDRLFLETHLIWGQSPSLRDAATAFIMADLNLFAGEHLCQIYSCFNEHGLIDSNIVTYTTNFTNQNVTTDRIVISCGNINVQNVTVQNGAKLTLDAAGGVNIISDFEVELGSEFEIKK
ncbi:MAG: M36 family metallopeptidase [Dysgonamonadaceae bacterium]|jgi:hypothetical protein|nr:M36 family metallopeptidase [Dysgonamonadaceae bacterium]